MAKRSDDEYIEEAPANGNLIALPVYQVERMKSEIEAYRLNEREREGKKRKVENPRIDRFRLFVAIFDEWSRERDVEKASKLWADVCQARAALEAKHDMTAVMLEP